MRTTATSAGPTIAVDDIRGFQYGFVKGVQTPVGAATTLTVTVGSNAYTLAGASPDVMNVSTAPNGVSGVLTFSGNLLVADATAGNTVQA